MGKTKTSQKFKIMIETGNVRYLNVREAAEFLGVAAGTLRNWVSRSKYAVDHVPFTKFSAGCLRFNSKELAEWAARRTYH
jgi:hypothetical protein